MGSFFSNVHIKKNETMHTDQITNVLTNMMKNQGYTQVSDHEQADGKLIVYNSFDSKWISICSDLIEFNSAEDSKKVAGPLSRELKTDVLTIGCFDSDYLFLNLVNEEDGTDAWADVGHLPAHQVLRKTKIAGWNNKVKDIIRLKAYLKEDYACSELFLDHMEELMNLPWEQGIIEEGCLPDVGQGKEVVTIYFAAANEQASKELPELDIWLFGYSPCKPGKSHVVSACNYGGSSRGLAIIFSGDYVEHDEITFSDVFFEYKGEETYTQRPITLEKVKASDGSFMYYWEDKNFYLPPKPNENLSPNKILDIESKRSFNVRFTPNGNGRKFLDIKVSFVPLENWMNGQCTWYVWKMYGSKERYIEESNKSVKRFGMPYNLSSFLNPNDYDL